jgi:hypothetical protein
MACRSLLMVCVALVQIAASAACSKQARPSAVASDRSGFMMGQVKVYKSGSDITASCEATFLDGSNAATKVSLDESGWVFSPAAPGLSRLSDVRCSVAQGLRYSPESLQFDVTESGQATYFGLIRFELASSAAAAQQGAAIGAASALGGLIGAVIAVAVVTAQTPNNAAQPAGVVTVLDMSKSAASAFRRRYGRELRAGFVSALPGQRYVEPVRVVQEGDLVSSDVDLIGASLTWLGVARPAQPRLAVRLRRPRSSTGLETCLEMEVVHDGTVVRIPVRYKVDSRTKPAQEMVQAEIDASLLEAVSTAKLVHLKACGLTRRLGAQARQAGAQLLERYRSVLAEQSAEPPAPSSDDEHVVPAESPALVESQPAPPRATVGD